MEGDNERRRSFVNKKTSTVHIFAANDTSVRSIHGISGN